MSIKFTYSTNDIYIKNPERSSIISSEKQHVLGRTNTGVLYRYNKGVTLTKITIDLHDINSDEKTALTTFYSLVNGSDLAFIYTHFDTVAYSNMIFTMESLLFTENLDTIDSYTTYTVGGNVYQTSTRKERTWNIQITMEQLV